MMTAARCPARSEPAKSQFRRLCMALHNRNYVRLTIMHGRCRSLSGLRGYRRRIKVVGPVRRRRVRAPAVHRPCIIISCLGTEACGPWRDTAVVLLLVA
jgi:hypothetical protein